MSDGRQAVVGVLLEELHGAWAPRDVADAVAARWRRGDAAAAAARAEAAAAPPQGRTRAWAAAALLLLGLAVVFALVVAQRREVRDDRGGAQDPQPGEVVPVPDLDALRALLPQVAHVELEVLVLDGEDLPTIDVSGVPLVAPADWTRRFLAALAADARVEPPAGWKWQNRLRFVLEDGRHVAMAVYTYERGPRQTLGLRGLTGDLSVGGDGADAVRGLLVAARHTARRAHGIVTGPSDLDGTDAYPREQAELRLFRLGDDDLRHLANYPDLRHLDVSGLQHPLSRTALRHLAACASLEELTAEGVEWPDDQLIPLTKLVKLHSWHLRGVRGFTGEGFFTMTNSAFHRAPTELLDLRDVPTLTDRGLRQIAAQAPRALLLGGSDARVGADGWRALVAAEGLQTLDLSGWALDAARVGDLAQHPTLAELRLDRCELDDARLAALGRGPAPLQTVSLQRARGITVAGLRALCERATLRRVDLTDVTGLDEAGLAQLAAARPDVAFAR